MPAEIFFVITKHDMSHLNCRPRHLQGDFMLKTRLSTTDYMRNRFSKKILITTKEDASFFSRIRAFFSGPFYFAKLYVNKLIIVTFEFFSFSK